MSTSTGEAIASVVFLIFAIAAGCAWAEFSCTSRAEKMGFKGDWGPIQGCMVKTQKRWTWPRRIYYWARRVILRESHMDQLVRVMASEYLKEGGIHELSTRESPFMRKVREDSER